jgi:peptidoglycan/xylan/chitin deacetylase (PgdA/CDA1 family)
LSMSSSATNKTLQYSEIGRRRLLQGGLAEPEGRDELGALTERGQVVASHTHHHTTASSEFAPDMSPAALDREVVGSTRVLERLSGRDVRAFAWREGTSLGADARADEALRSAGYEFLFTNHAVQQIT